MDTTVFNWTTTQLPALQKVAEIMFSWYDYGFFFFMLALSVLIGIYFGCFGTKQETANEYLLGGKKMKIFPIAMSLIASHVSGITLLGVPTEVYRFGASYWLLNVSVIIVCILTSYVYLPVFYKLQLTSTYEYLKLRFNSSLRIYSSFLYTLSVLLFIPIVIYLPALAFSQATGINVHYITPVVCITCIFYTTIGGLKAVVWTDTLQFSVTISAIIAVLFMGTSSAGGFSSVWNKALEGGRLDIFDFDPNPTKRDGFWAVLIGATVNWISHVGINQGCVQRFLSVPTISHARKSVFVFAIGMLVVKSVSVFTGLIMFAKYSDCDPLTTGNVKRYDQLLPYYVMDVAGQIPGLPGLFIAGVFSAALSTLSASLNTLAGTLYEDFVSRYMPPNVTQKQASNMLKIIVIVTGAICTALVLVVEKLGGILPLAISFSGITAGPLLGIFTLGMLFPTANSKGALSGGILGLLLSCWMVFGAQYYKAKGLFVEPTKPVSIEGCDFLVNATIATITTNTFNSLDQPWFFYRISFYYYSLFGTATTVLIGMVISMLTNKNDPPVHRDLLSPAIHWLLPKEETEKPFTRTNYYSVEKALEITTFNSEKEKEANKPA